jgi:Fic family protein
MILKIKELAIMTGRIMPLHPAEGTCQPQIELVHQVMLCDARLSNCLPEQTMMALGDIAQIAGVYHSSLIEGYDVQPEVFLNVVAAGEDTDVAEVRSLHKATVELAKADQFGMPAYSAEVIKSAHGRFYRHVNEAVANELIQQPGKYRRRLVSIGKHVPVEEEAIPAMMAKLQESYRFAGSKAHKVISVLGLHHRLAWIHPFLDGNGRVSRMVLQLALQNEGFSRVWSISRGLSRLRDDYYKALSGADQPRMGDLDGRGNLSNKRYVEFINFMLIVCGEEIQYAQSCLDRSRLSGCIDAYFQDVSLRPEGVSEDSHLAWKALFFQGAMPRGEFKRLIPKGDRTATGQVAALAKAGLVVTKTSRSDLTPKIPMPLARMIFQDF